MDIQWKKVPGFSRYEVSNIGLIRSLNYKRTGKTKELKPAVTGGYKKTVLLSDEGKYISITIHKVVCLAFLGKRKVGKEVNHKDGVKTNNNINNLEYVTRSENVKHAFDNSLCSPMHGSLNGNSKIKEMDVIEIRNYVKNFNGRYYGRKKLALKYGISEAHIKDIVNKRRDIWKYV